MITLGYSKNLLDKQPTIKGEINQRNWRVDLFKYERLPQGKMMPAGKDEILSMVAKTSLKERLHLPENQGTGLDTGDGQSPGHLSQSTPLSLVHKGEVISEVIGRTNFTWTNCSK